MRPLRDSNMWNYELYPRLSLLTLTGQEDGELEFIGTEQQWQSVKVLEAELSTKYETPSNK